MDFDIVHLNQRLGYGYYYRNKDMAHYVFWLTSDPVGLNDRNK